MTQPDLFTWSHKKARLSDPSTSKQAARQASGLASQHWQIITAYLRSIHPAGATTEGIAKATGLDYFAVARRMKELAEDGIAFPNGTVKLSSGRQGRIWYARVVG